MQQRYRKFSTYLKESFGTRVHKISVDANFLCPNIDGTIGNSGCIYCNNKTFSFQNRLGEKIPVRDQIEEGVEVARKRFNASKFIVYFQAHTNTYAPPEILKEKYDVIRGFKDVVGLSIATRPDCVNDEILKLISSYADNYLVCVEYGLQSIHDSTLDLINRGHRFKDFLRAFEMTKRHKNVKICAHLILGLPGETREMILETAVEMSRLKIDGIKIHPLHVVKDTALQKLFEEGEYVPLELNNYLELVADFLNLLWPGTVIERIGAFCPKEFLLAPAWVGSRNDIETGLEKLLIEKDYFQGKFYPSTNPNSYEDDFDSQTTSW